MGLLEALRQGVAIVDKVTKEAQPFVTLEHYAGQSGDGTRNYAAPVELQAVVDWKQHSVRTTTGQLSVSRASVQFLDATALSAATNGEGIADEDRITLPDGTTGPILDMGGFIDVGTGIPLATEVFLG